MGFQDKTFFNVYQPIDSWQNVTEGNTPFEDKGALLDKPSHGSK